MFGPVRGPWPTTEEWNGWWGDDPPYHTHVFVLTHHPRPSVVMDGGTVFHFATEGIGDALLQALDLPALGYRCVDHVGTPRASHVVLRRHG